jgi:hypothetical protein
MMSCWYRSRNKQSGGLPGDNRLVGIADFLTDKAGHPAMGQNGRMVGQRWQLPGLPRASNLD